MRAEKRANRQMGGIFSDFGFEIELPSAFASVDQPETSIHRHFVLLREFGARCGTRRGKTLTHKRFDLEARVGIGRLMSCFQGKTTTLSELIQYNLARFGLTRFNPLTEDFTECDRFWQGCWFSPCCWRCLQPGNFGGNPRAIRLNEHTG